MKKYIITIILYIIYIIIITYKLGHKLFIEPFTNPNDFTEPTGMYPTSMDSSSPGAFIISGIVIYLLPLLIIYIINQISILIIIKYNEHKGKK